MTITAMLGFVGFFLSLGYSFNDAVSLSFSLLTGIFGLIGFIVVLMAE